MRRQALRLVAALCLLAPACAPAPPVVAPAGGSVAVWDLDDLTQGSASDAGLGDVLAGPVIEVVRSRGFQVVERQRLLLVLEELRIGSSALADESTRLRLGRLAGARWMVFGGYQVYGGQMRIDLRLVDVETGAVRRAAQRTAPAGNLAPELEAARAAAQDLVPGG
ncbi:MAG: hypothetical protein HZB55_10720 [Deltaproteobacteria bacterium]|nr:hypothetical protein [Deltaproteobacteria bacterium]